MMNKATCGITGIGGRRVNHRVAVSPVGVQTRSLHKGMNSARMVVVGAKNAPEMPPIVSPTEGEPEWFACVARADFFFNDVQNEALAEQLRELKRYYEENDREQDFFFVCEPEWLNKFPEASKVKKPAVALVSTDKTWITCVEWVGVYVCLGIVSYNTVLCIADL